MSPIHYLLLSAFIFTTGVSVVVTRKQPLAMLMGIELMLQAANLTLVALTSWFQDWSGEIAVLVVLLFAAVELAIGLGAIAAYRWGRIAGGSVSR